MPTLVILLWSLWHHGKMIFWKYKWEHPSVSKWSFGQKQCSHSLKKNWCGTRTLSSNLVDILFLVQSLFLLCLSFLISATWLCWRRSLGGCDHQLTREVAVGSQRLLAPSTSLEYMLCPLASRWELFQGPGLEIVRCCWDHLDRDWAQWRPLHER